MGPVVIPGRAGGPAFCCSVPPRHSSPPFWAGSRCSPRQPLCGVLSFITFLKRFWRWAGNSYGKSRDFLGGALSQLLPPRASHRLATV
jgi:hypothetical protein